MTSGARGGGAPPRAASAALPAGGRGAGLWVSPQPGAVVKCLLLGQARPALPRRVAASGSGGRGAAAAGERGGCCPQRQNCRLPAPVLANVNERIRET